MANLEKLEIAKKQKKEEMANLIQEMQTAFRSTALSKPSGNIDVKRQQALIQSSNEMQAETKQKRALIEATLQELHEGMKTIKELLADAKVEKEDARGKIRALQEKMIEKKKTLVEALQEMELLQKKYAKQVNR